MGIVAAGRGTPGGWNPFVPGDDDGMFGLEEVRMDGTGNVLFVSSRHTFLMDDPALHRAVRCFLTRGTF